MSNHGLKELEMLRTLNRGAVIVSPKQAFFDMVAKLMGEEPEVAAEPFSEEEASVYLIDESCFTQETPRMRLKPFLKEIFFEELRGWYIDENRWPKDVTWKEFESYFHISFQSLVFNLGKDRLEYDPLISDEN